MNKKIVFGVIFVSMIFGETKNWNSHSAYLVPQKRWEFGLFQPFRYGYDEGIEYSIHPALFFVMPNISIKKYHGNYGGYHFSRKLSLFYPTPLLNIVAKEGIGGLIDPTITIPPLFGFSGTLLFSKQINDLNLTMNAGLDYGLKLEKLDSRSNIDLPLVYHRLGIFYNNWGAHAGVSALNKLTEKIDVFFDLHFRMLPGLVTAQRDPELSDLIGDYAIDHKLLLIWNKSETFRILTGYKLVYGQYPYGNEMRLLPYIPIMESWVPMIELQWAGKR